MVDLQRSGRIRMPDRRRRNRRENPRGERCDPSKSGLSGAIEPTGVAVGADGTVYVAEYFTTSSTTSARPARLRNIADPHITDLVDAIAVDGGKLYVGNGASPFGGTRA